MKKLMILMGIVLGLALNAFSQATEITQDEFYRQFSNANGKPYETSLQTTKKTEDYGKDGKISSTTETVTEYLNPDKMRLVEIERSGNRIKKFELIQIGETYYCRTNAGNWKKSSQWCGNRRFSILPEALESRITVEETKLNSQTATLYHQYLTYDLVDPSYLRNKFWINSEGFLIRSEMESGLLKSPRFYDKQVTVYEYNLKNIKIEAPIK